MRAISLESKVITETEDRKLQVSVIGDLDYIRIEEGELHRLDWEKKAHWDAVVTLLTPGEMRAILAWVESPQVSRALRVEAVKAAKATKGTK